MRKLVYLISLVFIIAIPIALARVDVPAKPKDLRDMLLQPKNSIYQEYGRSEETLLLYNIVALKEICQSYEIRIETLEKQVAGLTTIDPNSVTDPNE